MPVLTDDAQRFVGALTFSALASEPARTSLFGGPEPIPHTRLGQTADLVVVAPATAKLIGKYAAGISDDLLTATLLATRAPVLVCPAMHTEMWEHAAVQENLATLARRGVHVLEPEAGPPRGRRRRRRAGSPIPSASSPASLELLALVRGPAVGPAGARDRGRHPRADRSRCATSATGRRGRWATRSPRGRARQGARVVLVTTATQPVAAGIEVVRGRDRRADARRGARRAPTSPTSSSWRPRSPTSGRRRSRPRS